MLITADNDLDDNNLESSSEDDLPSIGEDENKHWGSLKSLSEDNFNAQSKQIEFSAFFFFFGWGGAGKSRKRGNNFRKFFCRINHIRLLYLHAKLQLKTISR